MPHMLTDRFLCLKSLNPEGGDMIIAYDKNEITNPEGVTFFASALFRLNIQNQI